MLEHRRFPKNLPGPGPNKVENHCPREGEGGVGLKLENAPVKSEGEVLFLW